MGKNEPETQTSDNLRDMGWGLNSEQLLADAAANYDPNWDKGETGNYGSANRES